MANKGWRRGWWGVGVVVLLVLAAGLWSGQKTGWGKQLITRLENKASEQGPAPVTAEEIVGQINAYRTENKMLALKTNERLSKAALARLRVVAADDDFSGTKTGLTLANAVKNNGYNYSLIADIYLDNLTPEASFSGLWLTEEAGRKTLTDGRLRDIGVALEPVDNFYRVVVILGRQASAPVERTGAGGYPVVAWGGPELWEAVNKRRVEMGVNPLTRRDDLCTIAAIRLNQLLELGKLDGHAGLEPLLNRDDLKSIREKYTLSEFLIVGYPTPTEAVYAWEHTLGHRALLAGGEYVWGCIYAQNTFGVAIAAY